MNMKILYSNTNNFKTQIFVDGKSGANVLLFKPVFAVIVILQIHVPLHRKIVSGTFCKDVFECIDGLVQNYSISIANALEILQSYTKQLISDVRFLWCFPLRCFVNHFLIVCKKPWFFNEIV